jgi:uncharacterized protein (TIGR00251 family)
MLPVKETERGLIFQIRVLPRSSRCGTAGIQGDALKIKITSPPVEGKANEECVRFLADLLGIRKSQVAIIAGHKSRQKTVAVSGIRRADLEALIGNRINA